MRRTVVVVAVVALLITLWGCGKAKEEGKGEKPKSDVTLAKIPQEMSATVISVSGKHSIKSKFAMKGEKFRIESDQTRGSYTIIRKDLKKVWMVMPESRSYIEIEEVRQEEVPIPEEKVKGEITRKVIGSETIDGHPCTKYEVTAKVDDKTMVMYQWWANDVGLPVKTAAVDGSWSMEYKDIKIGSQPDSLFEIPSGYKKMSMSGMPSVKGGKK